MKVVLAGGGTGGHAYPALSIAEALKTESPGCELLYMGSKGGVEARLAKEAGLRFCGLPSRKLQKLLSPNTLLVGATLMKGFSQAKSVLDEFKPDMVIGTGGYAAAAVVMAQAWRRGKTVIHEQNAVPGRTNLWLSRFASAVCVTFDDASKYFPPTKTFVTGLPIRSSLLTMPTKEDARKALGLEKDLFTVLVLGGSQGAVKLNDVTAESIPMFRDLPMQIIHQTGPRNIEKVEKARAAAEWSGYRVKAYFDDMTAVYAAADLVMCRCGASTIAEITAIGLPSILVPYPHAYADHQRFNGNVVARKGGGILIDDREITPKVFAEKVLKFMASPHELQRMAMTSGMLGRPYAALDVVRVALDNR
jgi:UDP-N-acetylglucosamine--N-acetylmuramyl-(pentapeptide) pyrophosphoryl-undecaprenol N-acetylglucosamine transferase